MIKAFILLALTISCAFADLGFDISNYNGALDQSDFSCLAQNGMEFAIIEIWMGGDLNSDFENNWQNAKNAGIQYVDAYAFICSECDGSDPNNICSNIVSNLPSGWDGQVWLDIENCDGCWSGDGGSNLDYVVSVAQACQGQGLNMGVYSSYYEWQQVTGSSDASSGVLTSLPLWYAHYDSSDDFDDWNALAFGGWGSPNMKQYVGNTNVCGINVDLDCY